MANKVAPYRFELAPKRQNKLQLADVTISTYADLIARGNVRGTAHSGAAILRLTQDDAETDLAKNRRREMGLYVATLARLHADQNLQLAEPPHNRFCMSIDVQHGECFQAPESNTRRISDLESACRFIAAMWSGA